MRSCIRLIHALFLAAALPAPLCAQFQEPTAEELKMTVDPKAPGASAVYLYREEKTDDQIHFHSLYARIKVLTEKGKELATVQTPYERGKFQVAAIEGRTIHPDGTVIRLTAKPSDLMDFKSSGQQFNRMVFTLPAVEVGSILEYRLQLRYSDDSVSSPEWIIQQPYFVHKAHYFFNPDFGRGHTITNSRGEVLDGLMYTARLGPDGQLIRDTMHRYTLDMTDIPALPDDDWMPPLNTIRWRVFFYYTNALSQADFWDKEGKLWAKEADRFAAPSAALKKAVSEIISAGDSEETKARKIYAAVMKIENRDFIGASSPTGRGGRDSKGNKDAAGVWKQQSGSGDEIAMLYVALARAAGLKAWPMQVVDRDRAIFEPTYLSTSQLDDYIATVQIDGKVVFLDPGQRMCSFGNLHWKHELASGLLLVDKGAVIAKTPAGPPKSSDLRRAADMTIGEDGKIEGSIRLAMGGQEALYWRQRALEKDRNEVTRELTEWMRATLPEGVTADFDRFEALDGYDSNLAATAKLSGTLGSATSKRLILPGLFFASRGAQPFVAQETRTAPIDLHYSAMEEDEVTYRFPAGVTMDSAPRPADIGWGDHASMSIRCSAQDGSIKVTRTFIRNSTVLGPGYYFLLSDFYRRMSTAGQQQIVLTRAKKADGS
jgi:hypothetical protein